MQYSKYLASNHNLKLCQDYRMRSDFFETTSYKRNDSPYITYFAYVIVNGPRKV